MKGTTKIYEMVAKITGIREEDLERKNARSPRKKHIRRNGELQYRHAQAFVQSVHDE